ncbi:hypothetical protein YC2023_058505 [Brassica napus]
MSDNNMWDSNFKVGELEAECMNLAKESSLPSNLSSDSHSDEGRGVDFLWLIGNISIDL